jgi:DNA invertase Pin-like site-specific DNA recombinase
VPTIRSPRRCAIYTRQSVVRADDTLTSCAVQRELCASLIASHASEGWVLLESRFDDQGISGATVRERPALRSLLRACADGRVDVIVVARIDRLTRNMHDWARLHAFLRESRIELVTLYGGFALGAAGTLTGNLIASFAEFEREMISDRLRDAHASHRSRGRRSAGRVPLGYTADRETRQLVVDADAARVVHEIFVRCASGESARTIAEWANASGFRSKVHGRGGGALWSARTILELLRNPVYRGHRRDDSVVIRAVHEAIVDKDLADRVEVALSERRTRPSAARSDAATNEDAFKLRGMLVCAACERVMTTTSSRARGSGASTTHRYYRCRGTPARPACEPPTQVAAAPIEGAVFEAIGRSILEGTIEARDMVFFLRLRPLWRVLSKQETWALLRQVIWKLEVTRDATIAHVGFDTVMIDVLAEEEAAFFADLPPRVDLGRLDRVVVHALLRMRARGAFGPRGAVSMKDDELESWIDLDYAAGRAAMRGTRRLRDNGFVLGPVLARMPEDSERGRP